MGQPLIFIIGVILGIFASVITLCIVRSGNRDLSAEKYYALFALIVFSGIYIYKRSKGISSDGLLIGVIVVGIEFIVLYFYEKIQNK